MDDQPKELKKIPRGGLRTGFKIPRQRWSWGYVILLLVGLYYLQDAWVQNKRVVQLSYDEFQSLLKDQKISEVVISDQYIRGQLKEPRADKKQHFSTPRVDADLSKELGQYGVKYTQIIESNFLQNLLSWILPFALFYGVWFYLGRRMAGRGGDVTGGLLSVGKSRAKIYVQTDVKTTFADVAGVDEAKEELKEVVSFLKDPQSYARLGARMPKGLLLVGPPGTGKTLLAKAVAGEANVPFFSISGSEFVEMFVGVGAARVRDLFEQARQKAPCIIFIDELDALGRARAPQAFAGGHDEKEQTLNQLLAELDGFDTKTGVVLLAATNRPEVLDPALLRSGRFDRQVLVDRPDKVGRVQILKVHVQKIKLSPDVQLDHIAAITPGFTGADLANLVNEAAIFATRRNADSVSLGDFTSAIERIVAGLEKKSRILNPIEKRTVAHHEMGHALVSAALPGGDKVHKISIIPRGVGALGYTMQRPIEDRYLMTQDELLNKLAVLLGGRSAELVIFGGLSTGAADDLARATDIARSIVVKYGMSSALGPVVYEDAPATFLGNAEFPRLEPRRYSEATAREIDQVVQVLVESAAERSRKILEGNRPLLEKGAALLLEKETLTEPELLELFRGVQKEGEPIAHAS